jgi:hypothetical protein
VTVWRTWLFGLGALISVPLLIGCASHLNSTTGAPVSATSEVTPDVMAQQASGVWGALETSPIVISPPIEYVPTVNWGRIGMPEWYFPNASADQARSFLESSGVAAGDLASVMATVAPAPSVQGVVVRPSFDVIRRLSPETRARVYLQLGKTPLNADQATAYRFYGNAVDDWLGTDFLAPSTRQLVESLVYRQNGFMFFADMSVVRTQVSEIVELQRLVKRLSRQATMLVKLRIDHPGDVGRIANYWGRAGRRTDIRPLLESIASLPQEADRRIDISHLLPPLPRQHLYRYQRVTVADFEKPVLLNCFWTALNFFNTVPNDAYLDVDVALQHLKKDYYIIHDGFQLGDIVAYSDTDGNLFHVAVYLADGLVFGKNGSSVLAPWSILPMERIKGHYAERSEGWKVTVHRRSDF